MEAPKTTVGTFFKTLTFLFSGMLGGIVLFAGVAIYLRASKIMTDNNADLNQVLAVVVLVVTVSGFFMSNYLFKQRIQDIRTAPSLAGKLPEYRSALILRLALLEAPALFTITAYLLTGDKVFMGLAVIVMLFFLSLKPKKEHALKDLELKGVDAQELEKDDTLL